jgi:hypothetical protein
MAAVQVEHRHQHLRPHLRLRQVLRRDLFLHHGYAQLRCHVRPRNPNGGKRSAVPTALRRLDCCQSQAAFAVSISSVYLPKRALLLHQAR